MIFPPAFLDRLRERLPLAEQVARRVRLTRRGSEYTGLCPFHNEKTPSFTVSDDKGFFHCFGCGAHGDVVGFAMRMDNLDFRAAVERLAGEAGLELPRMAPADAARDALARTLYDVLEAATDFFERSLAQREGEAGRRYLEGRGLDPAAIARFRLGWAPGEGRVLTRHLETRFPAELVEAAGLIRRSEDGQGSYDYFRGRVIFPILDRQGRPVGFGARTLGDAKPKYLNSPETALFHKGHQLYGQTFARAAVGHGAELIVVEGYMDVIALHLAGYEGAVAPLGTALTEAQLGELWRLAAEPVLCFDGDKAGARAAERALDRALPLLKPGHSLRFARLPEGIDPDDFIRRHGPGAFQPVLAGATPLSEMLWSLEHGRRPLDTPERRAEFEARLAAAADRIEDHGVRDQYRRYLKDLTFERLRRRWRQGPNRVRAGDARPARRGSGRALPEPPRPHGLPALPDPAVGLRRHQEILVRIVLDYPALLEEVLEEFAALPLPASDLDTIRHAIINLHATNPALDAQGIREHLGELAQAASVDALYGREVSRHVEFAAGGAEIALDGWKECLSLWYRRLYSAEAEEQAVGRFERQPGNEAWSHLVALTEQARQETEDQVGIAADRAEREER